MQTKDRNRRSEFLVSIVIAVALTILFVGQTVLDWPDPMHLSRFHLEYYNPFSGIFG